MLSWEWRCSWSSADRRCSNYIWVIDNFITYYGASYIRGFTVLFSAANMVSFHGRINMDHLHLPVNRRWVIRILWLVMEQLYLPSNESWFSPETYEKIVIVVVTIFFNITHEQNTSNTNLTNKAYPGYCKHVWYWRPPEKALAYLYICAQ